MLDQFQEYLQAQGRSINTVKHTFEMLAYISDGV